MLPAIGKQKFTKALVLSGGASVVEVDVGHAARAGSSRYSPLRLTRLALHVLAGFWPQPIQWIGIALGVLCTLLATVLARLRGLVLDRPLRLPGAAARRRRGALRPRHPGLHPRAGRGVPRQNSARGRGPASLLDRRRSCCRKRVLVTGGAGFISSNFIRHLLANTGYEVVSLDALTYAGNLENLADVMGARAALVRPRRHPRRRARREGRRGGGRDRERGGRVARREVDRRGRVRVRDDERRGDADPARRDPANAGRALHPDLVERGVRDGRVRADGRGAPAQPALARTRRRRPAATGSRTRTSSPTGCRS